MSFKPKRINYSAKIKGIPKTATPLCGAVLVEVAFLMPFLFAGIFSAIWCIMFFNHQISLRTATSNAIRLGIGRGELYAQSKGSTFQVSHIQPLDQWINSNGCSSNQGPSNTALFDLLVQGDGANFKFYNTWSQEAFNKPFCQLPSTYIYSVVYANALIRSSLGKGVRFPCDPAPKNATEESVEGSLHCLKCMPLNPYGDARTQGNASLPAGIVTLECTVNYPNTLIAPALDLLSMITGMPSFPRYSTMASRFTIMSPQ